MSDKFNFKNCKVFFSDSNAQVKYPEGPLIVLSPVDDGWNDFKYKTHYEYKVLHAGHKEYRAGNVFLGFTEKHELISERGVIQCDNQVVSAEDLPPFFTMAGGMDDYRKLVTVYSFSTANEFLLLLNDVVALKRDDINSKIVTQAEKTGIFRLGFMRSGDMFFAYNNAFSILDGLNEEELGVMSSDLTLEYKLSGFNQPHRLNMKFNPHSILPKRINVLIGRNGLGKSQALNRICQSLLNDDDESFLDTDRGRPLINRLLAIASPGETIDTFPEEKSHKKIKYRRLALGSKEQSKHSKGLGDSLVQLARADEYIKGKRRWKIFSESISGVSDFIGLALPMDCGVSVQTSSILPIDDRYYALMNSLRSGGEQALREIWGAVIKTENPVRIIDGVVSPLSSGQLAFLKFAVQSCMFIENGTLVLLDEPETHLHPNFISDFIRLLDFLLEATGSQAIMATHSAYFVREVPSEQVLVFKRDGDSVNILRPRLKTFGADVGAISYFIFEDKINNNLVNNIIEKLSDNKEIQAKELKLLESELSSDLIMYLRRHLELEE